MQTLLVWPVIYSFSLLLQLSALLFDIAEYVLLHFLVFIDLYDRLTLRVPLCLRHLVFAERDDAFLFFVLALDHLLEVVNVFIKLRFRVNKYLTITAETRDLLEIVKAFATVFEEILRMMNVSFLKGLVNFFSLSIVLLVFIIKLLTFEFSLVIVESLILLFLINQLVVQVLEAAQICDNLPLVLFISSFLEGIARDLKNLKVVAKTVQVLN